MKYWCETLPGSKNDQAWEKLFATHSILSEISKNGYFIISATQINCVREARLMTKFDHQSNLPHIFADNQLAILPLTRGSYIISAFAAYHKFTELSPLITKVPFPAHLQTLEHEHITSEALAVNSAYVSGIIADFVDDESLLPTVCGRMSSGSFQFQIHNQISKTNMLLNINNSQLEIDGGFEGQKYLTLLEAKNSLSADFLVRQLYYPWRLWSARVTKPVKPVFMVYSNGIYCLYEYVFSEPCHYNSLTLIRQRRYRIAGGEICWQDIQQLLAKTPVLPEPDIAFPQADQFSRVINLCELLAQNELSKEEITANYDFDPRQTNYYTDAARYLGLVAKRRENQTVVFALTAEGDKLFKLNYQARQLRLAALMLQHQIFRTILQTYCSYNRLPDKTTIIRAMQTAQLYRIASQSTYKRRASTVLGWLNWLINLPEAD